MHTHTSAKPMQDSTGTAVACQSFEFTYSTNMCTLSTAAAQPFGTGGALTANKDKLYGGKACVPADSFANCVGPMFLSPSHVLVGLAQMVVTTTSFADCTSMCVNSDALFGFKCTSGMYYSALTSDNCILNSANRLTNNDLYVPATNEQVTYYEPNCSPTARLAVIAPSRTSSGERLLAPNELLTISDEWGAWTTCDGTEGRWARAHH